MGFAEDLLIYLLRNLKVYYYVTDSFGNVIYPRNSKDIEKVSEILKYEVDKNGLIHMDCNLWYEYKFDKIIKNGNEFNIVTLTDVTKYKENEVVLEKDETTSLLNKRAAFREMDEYIESAIFKDVPFAIVIGDIDFFKNFNDEYGHIAGDLVLKEIAQILLQYTNRDDKNNIIGRFGGEEFIMLLDNLSYEEALKNIENIRNVIGKLRLVYDNKEIKDITMSFGIYYYNPKQNSKLKLELDIEKIRNDFMECADKALYHSKENGRNKVTFYNELNN